MLVTTLPVTVNENPSFLTLVTPFLAHVALCSDAMKICSLLALIAVPTASTRPRELFFIDLSLYHKDFFGSKMELKNGVVDDI